MKILFVCKYNRFRSKVAEAYFNKINKNKKIRVESAGIIKVDKLLLSSEKRRNKFIKKKFNLDINTKSRGLSVSLLEKADKIIIVADDIPKIVFNHPSDKKKVVIWKIQDALKGESKVVKPAVNKIMKKVEKLVKQLENKKWLKQ